MKDINEYSFDGTSVFINSTLISARIGKIILLILYVAAWVGFGLLFAYGFSTLEDTSNFIIPVILIVSILVFGFGRFVAWNLWGKEYIRVSVNSVTYCRSYGVVRTAEKTIKFRRFNYAFEIQKNFDGEDYGKFFLYDYGEDDNPQVVFENGIFISNKIASEVSNLFDQMILQRDHKYDEMDYERINLN